MNAVAMPFLQSRRGNRINIRRTLSAIASTLFVVMVTYWLLCDDEIFLGDGVTINIDDYETFEDELDHDFVLDNSNSNKIPRILHQTWNNANIPAQFIDNIQSFINYNPTFQYYLWTDDSARMLIKEKHPYLLDTFDNYVEPVRKADLIRYVVLYEFGGIYADLDTQCLRPLGRVLSSGYACVVSPEPFEHASLIYNTDNMVTNSIMFCKMQHPFLKTLMINLPAFSHFSKDIDASGPNYMTLFYKQYRKEVIEKRQLPEDHMEYIYQAASQYFQSEIDPIRHGQFRSTCKKFTTLNKIQKKGCVTLKKRGLGCRVNKYTYTKHAFYHTGYKLMRDTGVPITNIVTHAKIYDHGGEK